jgi:hypothetical protein
MQTTSAEARSKVTDITDANVLIIPPPLIDGIGSAGGYRMMVRDRGGHGYRALGEESTKLIAKANATRAFRRSIPSSTATASSRISTGASPTCWAFRRSASSKHSGLSGFGLRQ